MDVLTVNAGSTSTKVVTVADGTAVRTWPDLAAALAGPPPDVVGHRVVHGGDRAAPVLLDDALVAELRDLVDLAPLHQPPALDAIDACRRRWPDAPQVAAFDTAFHATIPPAARTYALPARYRRTVRASGFHGLSYAWAVGRIGRAAPEARRVLVAHLGGGQSLCAARDGHSVMTTMGFTPLDGLVMATRSGTVDPGALLWLARHHPDDDLGHVLEHESGLLGLAGTADMREIHRRVAAGDADAQLAFAVWTHRAVTLAGACTAALGGLDALAFTGGIGEHDPIARRAITSALDWVGVATDDPDDAAPPDDTAAPDDLVEITARGAAVRTFVVAAREDLQLAAHAVAAVTAHRAQ